MGKVLVVLVLAALLPPAPVGAQDLQGLVIRKTNLRTGETRTVILERESEGQGGGAGAPSPPATVPESPPEDGAPPMSLSPGADGQYTPEQLAQFQKVFGRTPPPRMSATSRQVGQ